MTEPDARPPDALSDDLLKRLASRELEGRREDFASLAEALAVPTGRLARALQALASARWLASPTAPFELTAAGRQRGRFLLRSHRLLETHLARETGLAPEDWHAAADRAEHTLSPQQANALADELGNPRFDPHGDPIPDRHGRIVQAAPPTLLEWPEGTLGRIVHLEDEPPALFARLCAAGLAPGVLVRLLQRGPEILAIEADGRQRTLLAAEAGLVFLETLPPARAARRRPLADLAPDAEAVIAALSPLVRGRARQRLLDLGLVPGTRIARTFTAALHSPVAFRVRGTLIALRREQTEQILIEAAPGASTP